MRIFTKPPGEGKYFPVDSFLHQPANCKLFVSHHNIQMTASGRTTTIYKISDDTNDVEQLTASFFLMPDPYSKVKDCEYNCLQDFISEQEEMMLFDKPPIDKHSLYKK